MTSAMAGERRTADTTSSAARPRMAACSGLAAELVVVFEEKGIHREALAALKIFHQATEREEATAELARRGRGSLVGSLTPRWILRHP